MRTTAPITTTDLLKFAGLLFVFADHTGLFFAPDEDWWRVVGRAAAPIFFFLIGFARASAVPLNWIVLGSILTFLDLYVSDDLEDVTLNILFNFALIRLTSPFIDAYVLPRRWGLAALAVFCAAMIPLAAIVLEYGAEGWLWALFGMAAREALAKGAPEARLQRNLVAAFCIAVYLFTETRDFEFEAVENAALAALIIGLGLTLVSFRRTDAFNAPAGVARAFNWIGRHSLEIYAVSLFLMQATGSWLDAGDREGDDA
ncbi:MAG: TraX family protein [Beijerinckiaceae bacterium]